MFDLEDLLGFPLGEGYRMTMAGIEQRVLDRYWRGYYRWMFWALASGEITIERLKRRFDDQTRREESG